MITTVIGPETIVYSAVATDEPYHLNVDPVPHENVMGRVIDALTAAHPGVGFRATLRGVQIDPGVNNRAPSPRSVAPLIGAAIGRPFRLAPQIETA